MSEERLRDLLERAVPEAPEIHADEVPERAMAVRRRQLVAGGAALAVVATAIAAAVVGRGSEPGTDPSVADEAVADPYGIETCPVSLPEQQAVAPALPRAVDVVAIRLCPDLSPDWYPRNLRAPRPGDVRRLKRLDALVQLDGFWKAVAEQDEYDGALCATIDFVDDDESLMFVLRDGTTAFVRTGLCTSVSTASGQVDGGVLTGAFKDALNAQRQMLLYTLPYEGVPRCDTRVRGGPGLPGREQLTSAVFCPPHGPAVPLTSGQLDALRAAWSDPMEITRQLNVEGGGDCVEGGGNTSILAGTDHSDVVRLFPSRCDYLAWDGWDENLAIPITLEELGLR